MANCIFCRQPFGPGRTRSNEHVFPLWLGLVLPPGRTIHRIIPPGQTQPSRSWTTDDPDIKVRQVCKPCNEGWMHDIETNAKPYLTSMIQGRGREFSPRGRSAEYVACWILKTVLTLQYAGAPHERVAPDEDYDNLYKARSTLPGTYVWLGVCPDGSSMWSRSRTVEMKIRRTGEAAEGYAATVRVGHLVFEMIRIELTDWPVIELYGQFENFFVPVWPLSKVTRWPPKLGLPQSSVELLGSVDTIGFRIRRSGL